MRRPPSAEACAAMLAALRDVDDHRATAEPDGPTFQETFAGDVVWRLSNGWRVKVFNDCDEWDYVDSMAPPPGLFADETDADGWIDLFGPAYGDEGYTDELADAYCYRADIRAVTHRTPGNDYLWPGLLREYGPEREPPPAAPMTPEAQAAFAALRASRLASLRAEAAEGQAREENACGDAVRGAFSALAAGHPVRAASLFATAVLHAAAAQAYRKALDAFGPEPPLVIDAGAPAAVTDNVAAGVSRCRVSTCRCRTQERTTPMNDRYIFAGLMLSDPPADWLLRSAADVVRVMAATPGTIVLVVGAKWADTYAAFGQIRAAAAAYPLEIARCRYAHGHAEIVAANGSRAMFAGQNADRMFCGVNTHHAWFVPGPDAIEPDCVELLSYRCYRGHVHDRRGKDDADD